MFDDFNNPAQNNLINRLLQKVVFMQHKNVKTVQVIDIYLFAQTAFVAIYKFKKFFFKDCINSHDLSSVQFHQTF